MSSIFQNTFVIVPEQGGVPLGRAFTVGTGKLFALTAAHVLAKSDATFFSRVRLNSRSRSPLHETAANVVFIPEDYVSPQESPEFDFAILKLDRASTIDDELILKLEAETPPAALQMLRKTAGDISFSLTTSSPTIGLDVIVPMGHSLQHTTHLNGLSGSPVWLSGQKKVIGIFCGSDPGVVFQCFGVSVSFMWSYIKSSSFTEKSQFESQVRAGSSAATATKTLASAPPSSFIEKSASNVGIGAVRRGVLHVAPEVSKIPRAERIGQSGRGSEPQTRQFKVRLKEFDKIVEVATCLYNFRNRDEPSNQIDTSFGSGRWREVISERRPAHRNRKISWVYSVQAPSKHLLNRGAEDDPEFFFQIACSHQGPGASSGHGNESWGQKNGIQIEVSAHWMTSGILKTLGITRDKNAASVKIVNQVMSEVEGALSDSSEHASVSVAESDTSFTQYDVDGIELAKEVLFVTSGWLHAEKAMLGLLLDVSRAFEFAMRQSPSLSSHWPAT
jgi:hypothetical protein